MLFVLIYLFGKDDMLNSIDTHNDAKINCFQDLIALQSQADISRSII